MLFFLSFNLLLLFDSDTLLAKSSFRQNSKKKIIPYNKDIREAKIKENKIKKKLKTATALGLWVEPMLVTELHKTV